MSSNFRITPAGSNPEWDRWPAVFEPPQSMFAPGEPLSPVEQEQVRSYDFPVGINTIIYPRVPERWGFSELKAFSNVELVRLAIETRKDQMERLDWQIRPRDDRIDGKGNKKKQRVDAIQRIKKVTKFFEKPDGEHDFHVWLRIIMEDLMVLDAPAMEKQRTRGGDLAALPHMPGDTVKILVDSNGRRPQPPAPAYQQIIKGRVWANLTADDIIYAPRNPRAGKLYGQGPVEQCLVTINTIMRRQASQLAYFSDGSVPAGLATVPDGWTIDQVKAWQEWMDASFSGNLAERRKLLWAPAGSKYQAFKEAPLKDDYDEWLARIICYCFSLPPTPFIRQMNRSTAQADNERALQEGLAPLLIWSKRQADRIIHEDLGMTDLEFAWNDEKEIDILTQSTVNNTYVRAGVLTINEVRDNMGMEKIQDGDTPLIYTAGGAITLENILNPPDPEQQMASQSGGTSLPKPKTTSEKPKDSAEKSIHIEDDRWVELLSVAGSIENLQKSVASTLSRTQYGGHAHFGA
jgi:hypothetical protein